ncbi:GNAT family N-acetyltransferase [Bacillus sp. 3H-10]|nr:GNAT family N-acetyltransferase [Bacillus aquiflavi]
MLDYGFSKLNLHRIEPRVYDHNERGIYVYEKLGFKKEGVLREYLFSHRRYYDLIIMSMLENEYRKKYVTK